MPDFYGTASGFTAYHNGRGRDLTDLTLNDTKINASLLNASEWLDGKYRSSFDGLKVGMRSQIREWPRVSAFDVYRYLIPSDSVPIEVENATYEAAYRDIVSPGSLAVDWTPPQYKSASVDGAISVQYSQFVSASDIQTQFAIIDQILSSIIGGCGDKSSLSGGANRV